MVQRSGQPNEKEMKTVGYIAPKAHPKLARHELGRYIVCDLIDHLAEVECTLRALKKQAENALAALSEKEGE